MTCAQFRKLWHRQQDGGASLVDFHLRNCASCRNYVNEMKGLIGVLDELSSDTSDLANDAPVVVGTVRRSKRWLGTFRLTRIAAMITVLLTGWLLWTSIEPKGSSPPVATQVSNEPEAEIQQALGVSLRENSARHLVAVSALSQEPNVQMVWLYPTLQSSVGEGRFE